jgi:hypothetical protein
MRRPTSVRIRGIYTTALTALLLEHGYTIVDPSPAIQARFGLQLCDTLADVFIRDRRNRQGVIIGGESECTSALVQELQRALPHALFSLRPDDSLGSQERGDLGVNPGGAPWVRYHAEFSATVKAQLDHLRSRIVPTIPGHHALKVVDADAVDAAEQTLAADPDQRTALVQHLQEALVFRHFQPGMDLPVYHIKAGHPRIILWGQIERVQASTLMLGRRFQGGGMYDGLRLSKAAGDWGTLELTAGAWVTVRRYFRQDGSPVGELYNIGTPVECYPDHLRYVDLELDVVRLPDGTSRLEDVDVLVDKLARGLLPPALGQEAICRATDLLQQLTAMTARERWQP